MQFYLDSSIGGFTLVLNRQLCSLRYSFRILQLHILPMTGLWLICQSYTFMSRIFILSHERAFQRILTRFIFVINVRNNRPPEQLGYRQKHPTTKPTSYTLWPIWYTLWPIWYTLWPIWSCFVADVVVANMVCGRYGIGPVSPGLHVQWLQQ